MLLHKNPLFQIFFGDAKDGISAQTYQHFYTQKNLINNEPFSSIQKRMRLDRLLFLHQVHGVDGVVITAENVDNMIPFAAEGDFLVTNVSRVGLGVLTADCLPIVMYDSAAHVIALVHAGWQGAVKGVVLKALDAMQQQCKTKLEHIRIFFGPSAKVCCYQVQDDFKQHLENIAYGEQALHRHGDKLFFDLPLFNKLQLEDRGIKKEAFHLDYNVCTIDQESFFSYRRQGQQAGRQLTIAALK